MQSGKYIGKPLFYPRKTVARVARLPPGAPALVQQIVTLTSLLSLLPGADTTMMRAALSARIMSPTRLMLSALAMDVPPNFNTLATFVYILRKMYNRFDRAAYRAAASR